MLLFPPAVQKMFNVVFKLKNKHSCGPDNIFAKVLKKFSSPFGAPMTYALYQQIAFTWNIAELF